MDVNRSHNRGVFGPLTAEGWLSVCHVRYNAAHRGAETETFPLLGAEGRPGVVTFTATRWGQLLDPRRRPPGEASPSAADCYRFALTHPSVDVCMVGTRDLAQMREAPSVLDRGPLSPEVHARMCRIGDHLQG